MKAKVTRYPNNEVRVAVYPERYPKDAFAPIETSPPENNDLVANPQGSSPVEGSDSLFSDLDPPFNIKSKVDTPQKPLRWELSRYGRNQVLRAGACFSNSPDTERLLLTGTLPGSSLDAFKALADFSTYATKTLSNWVCRRWPSAKWEYCWEFQKRGALHVHFVCEVGLDAAAYIKSNFKAEWIRILRAIQVQSGVDMYRKTSTYSNKEEVTQADVTVCDREPSRYISKYISKASTNAKGFSRFPPKTWYQISRSLLRELRERTTTFLSEGLSYAQALLFIEDATHTLSTYEKSGHRRFDGAVLAWSGYAYGDHFDIQSWGKTMKDVNDRLMPVRTLLLHAMTMVKDVYVVNCRLRSETPTGTLTLAEALKGTEDEMELEVRKVMVAVSATWKNLNGNYNAARFMFTSMNWFERKYGNHEFTPDFFGQIEAICNNKLTG